MLDDLQDTGPFPGLSKNSTPVCLVSSVLCAKLWHASHVPRVTSIHQQSASYSCDSWLVSNFSLSMSFHQSAMNPEVGSRKTLEGSLNVGGGTVIHWPICQLSPAQGLVVLTWEHGGTERWCET